MLVADLMGSCMDSVLDLGERLEEPLAISLTVIELICG